MVACIIAVGSEMLTPFRVDTNSLFVTEQLNTIGVDVRMKAVVGDDVGELMALLRGALEWAGVIAVAGVLNVTMSEDAGVIARIEERFNRRGIKMPDINRRQGMVPQGATLLDN